MIKIKSILETNEKATTLYLRVKKISKKVLLRICIVIVVCSIPKIYRNIDQAYKINSLMNDSRAVQYSVDNFDFRFKQDKFKEDYKNYADSALTLDVFSNAERLGTDILSTGSFERISEVTKTYEKISEGFENALHKSLINLGYKVTALLVCLGFSIFFPISLANIVTSTIYDNSKKEEKEN